MQGMHSFHEIFHLYKKNNKQTERSHGRGLDTFLSRKACNCSKGRRMHNAWTKEAPEHL